MATGIKKIIFVFVIFTFPLFAQLEGKAEKDTSVNEVYSNLVEFHRQMDDIFDDPNFSNANWGVIIQSLKTGEYFYKRNASKLFVPASNMKLFTTAAGLVLLGEDYRFKSEIYTRGKIDGSTLDGDLIWQGGGDPTISGRFYNDDIFKVFDDWADSLQAKGIDEIRGNIIGDDNKFDNVGLGKGWAWDHESYWYSAPSGAVSFNDNCVDIIVTVDRQKKKAVIKTIPDTKYIVIVNDIIVVPKDSTTNIDVYRQRGTNIVNVFGTIRNSDDSVKTYVTVNNPTQYSVVVLKDILQKKGIEVDGYPIDVDDISAPLDYNSMSLLFTYYSPPLKEIIKAINKNSINFFAEQLLKIIGYEKFGWGTAVNGVNAISPILKEMGINPHNMVMVDGSGLSPLNLVSPKQILNLLTYMYKSKYFIAFYNSLPIAGVDGTFGERLKNTDAVNKIRAKPGYLDAVRSLSGYAFTADNEPVAFSMIVNNFVVPVKLAENIQDLVCLRLANFKRK